MKVSIAAVAESDIPATGLLLRAVEPGRFRVAGALDTPSAISGGTAREGEGFVAYRVTDEVFTLMAGEALELGDQVMPGNVGHVMKFTSGGYLVGRTLATAKADERVKVMVDLVETTAATQGTTSGVTDSPQDGKSYVRRMGAWEPIPENLLSDPYHDGKLYGRKDGKWIEIPAAPVTEAPGDGKLYARSGGRWYEVDQQFLKDSPADGKLYARSGGAWIVVPPVQPPALPPVSGSQTVKDSMATLRSDVAALHVDVTGTVTLFNPSAPAVAPGKSPGQRLLVSAGPGSVTIQGVSEYAHAGVVLGASRRLAPGAWLSLEWSGSVWVETSYLPVQ
jgi:hypothetical protein